MLRRSLVLALFVLAVPACDEVDDPLDANADPTAVIDAESTGERGIAVVLDGSASHDPDGDDLEYTWTFTSRPAGSAAALTGASSEDASFVPDMIGSYTVQLSVSDGDADDATTTTIVVDVQTLGSIGSDSIIANTNSAPGEADYRVADNATVTFSNDVTIQPGVTIRMGAGSAIYVPSGGSLRAVGTAALPIRFVGANDAAGFWTGIEIDSNNSLNELTHVEIANGGDFGYANLWLDGTVKISNSTFRESETYGIDASSSAALPVFANNTFQDNELGAMRIPASLIGSLDAASNYAGTAATGVVHVYGASVSGTQTWPSINTVYRLDDNATITVSGAVTVAPGVDFVMGEGSALYVATGGSLSAVGTAADSIRFVGANNIDGHWTGLEIDSNNAANRLSYVVIANAGDFNYAGLWLDGTARIDHSHFRDSQTTGIFASSSSLMPDFSSNRFTGSVEGPIELPADLMGSLDAASVYAGNTVDFISVYGASTGSTQTWRDTDVPFFLQNNATITINSAITVNPGFRLHAGEGSSIYVASGGTISAIGTAADSIQFRGASATPGYWTGIEIDSNTANTMAFVRIGNGGAFSYANIWLDGTLVLSNSHIYGSSTYGVDYDDTATFTATNVTYASNALGNTHVH